MDLYLVDKHVRALKHMNAASEIHPGFPDVERVREDCMVKYQEQGGRLPQDAVGKWRRCSIPKRLDG